MVKIDLILLSGTVYRKYKCNYKNTIYVYKINIVIFAFIFVYICFLSFQFKFKLHIYITVQSFIVIFNLKLFFVCFNFSLNPHNTHNKSLSFKLSIYRVYQYSNKTVSNIGQFN